MATQAIISITRKGHVFIKIVVGCNGYNAEKLLKIIEDIHPQKIEDIYNMAIVNKFGCKDCLVVMNNKNVIFKGDDELGPLYRETFDNPCFNPRWKNGTADIVAVTKY